MSNYRTKVYVIGVGMTPFTKPGKSEDYPVLGTQAATKALLDANVNYADVQAAFVGYCYGDSTAGQRALYPLGQTSIPIINVSNNCATGSSALYLAHQAVVSGQADCAMALGFEKMAPGSLSSVWNDRANPLEPHLSVIGTKHELDLKTPMAPTIFGLAGQEYCQKKGVSAEDQQRHIMSKIAWKNHLHSTRNPYSQFRDEYTLAQIEQSRKVFGPLTMLQCCPTSDGAACAILASERFVHAHGLAPQAVELAGIALATDVTGAFASFFTDPANIQPKDVSFMKIAGADMTEAATTRALGMANVHQRAVRVVELHDCFSANELVTVDALGLTDNSIEFVQSFERRPYGVVGKGQAGQEILVNPSGGLISKGHPLGATGLAQCAELTWQLRGWCGDRQAPDLDVALQHNLGLGGACVVAVYKRPNITTPGAAKGWNDPRERLGYNPALTARDATDAEIERARAKAGGAAIEHLKAVL